MLLHKESSAKTWEFTFFLILSFLHVLARHTQRRIGMFTKICTYNLFNRHFHNLTLTSFIALSGGWTDILRMVSWVWLRSNRSQWTFASNLYVCSEKFFVEKWASCAIPIIYTVKSGSQEKLWTLTLDAKYDTWTLDVWTPDDWKLGIWVPECLDSGRLNSGHLSAWTLDAWTLGKMDAWTLEHFDSEHLDTWW